ncbi:EAL domain-containing protein [Escherichia coli]|uniref:EAL domain-containing protein n=4 Tax=Escherichia coli TaxID=562 RepID=UPI001302A4EE|nr:EAL domain-containing protein [Escherichia coli]KAE9788213.1 EAL domain-containing protein [Escherichia coli]MWN30235.1 EAL domain-containing protein [Escherichia coli]MWN46214.1 EAL domain-containing protein [Escherichia coli]MWN50827.1 EAL domain-containing protein [Escherichia coli]MWN56078.1 EAL domain-containing protein [Escherichia coli]
MKHEFISTDRLSLALSNGEFEPYIQPIVSASDLRLLGVELLVRWHIPTGEIIPPAYFINHADSAGLLSPLTVKILNRTVDRLSEIKAMLPCDFRIAVNVTPGVLADREFTQRCLELTKENDIHLILELTEQQPFYMDRQTDKILGKLSKGGVKFAIDDFGTGYSVLSYLKYFPVSYIKIDKSFTQDILSEKTSQYIMESIIGLAEKLCIDTVAEGIESQEQITCLRVIGVNYFQGYYFGRPEKLTSFCDKYEMDWQCKHSVGDAL